MSFADELRRAIEAAPRVSLPDVSKALWKAFAEGQISEVEAEALHVLLEVRQRPSLDPRTAPRADDARRPGEAPGRHRGGSRPHTSQSLARRRNYASSGRMPETIASQFTQGERAVLAVVVCEVVKHGVCDLHVGALAALAGVGMTTARGALREARRLGLVTIEERRIARDRNLSNIVRIVDLAWCAWIRMGGKRGGWARFSDGPDSSLLFKEVETVRIRENGSSGGVRRHQQGQDGPRGAWDEPWRPSTGRGRR